MNDQGFSVAILFIFYYHLTGQMAVCFKYFDSSIAISSATLVLQKTWVVQDGHCFSNIIAH